MLFTNVIMGVFLLLLVLVIYKALDTLLKGRQFLRNDDDVFKVGSTAYFQNGPGSERYKEYYGERRP